MIRFLCFLRFSSSDVGREGMILSVAQICLHSSSDLHTTRMWLKCFITNTRSVYNLMGLIREVSNLSYDCVKKNIVFWTQIRAHPRLTSWAKKTNALPLLLWDLSQNNFFIYQIKHLLRYSLSESQLKSHTNVLLLIGYNPKIFWEFYYFRDLIRDFLLKFCWRNLF